MSNRAQRMASSIITESLQTLLDNYNNTTEATIDEFEVTSGVTTDDKSVSIEATITLNVNGTVTDFHEEFIIELELPLVPAQLKTHINYIYDGILLSIDREVESMTAEEVE